MLTAGEISSDRQTLKMNDFLKQIEAYSNDKLDKFMPSMSQAQQLNKVIGSSSSMAVNSSVMGNGNGSVISNYTLNHQAKIAEQVKNLIDREMAVMSAVAMRTTSSKRRYQQNNQQDGHDESRGGGDSGLNGNADGYGDDEYLDDPDQQQEDSPGKGVNPPDYVHLLSVISDSFNSLIHTFTTSPQSFIIGQSLARVKESYEEIINSIVENLSSQIESLNIEVDNMSQENIMLKERNGYLEKKMETQERSSMQIDKFARQNEKLEKELSKLFEENKIMKREQNDRDSQLIESQKIIEKLSAS